MGDAKLCIAHLGFGTDDQHGCQEKANCAYAHDKEFFKLLKRSMLEKYPLVKAWLVANCNGTRWEKNELSGDRAKKMTQLGAKKQSFKEIVHASMGMAYRGAIRRGTWTAKSA